MKRREPLIVAFVVIVAGCLAQPVNVSAQQCGHERWAVKTGTDAGAGNVDLSHPRNATIADLIRLTAPHPLPANNRSAPTEDTVFVVNATLREFKMESGAHGDSDYHLVLADDSGNTMVAEIPLPDCVGTASPFKAQIAAARAKFDGQFSATSSFQTAAMPVQVTGVGFFDFFHNQTGAAPNVIELHPVLDIVFNPQNVSAPDFSISVSPSTASVNQGGSLSSTITANAINGFSSPIAFVASDLPSGVTATLTPIGPNKSSLTLTASSAATPGTFPVTVTGSGGNKTHTAALSLHVKPSAPPASTGQQWEYRSITANSDQDLVNRANSLGAQEWEMVGVVRNQNNSGYVAFFRRPKQDF